MDFLRRHSTLSARAESRQTGGSGVDHGQTGTNDRVRRVESRACKPCTVSTEPPVSVEPTADAGAPASVSAAELKRRARNARYGLALGVIGAVFLSALLVTSVFAPTATPGTETGTLPVATPAPTATPTATDAPPRAAAVIPGVQTFTNTPSHVRTPVSYPQTPPAGGAHDPVWLNCGVYTEAVPNENAVHSLEHGAIWVTYDPALGADELTALRAALPADHVIISPFVGLPDTIVLTGWNVQLRLDSVSDPRIPDFVAQYRNGANAPEPGESCSDSLDAPGKIR